MIEYQEFLNNLWRNGTAAYWWTAQDSKSRWFKVEGNRRVLPDKDTHDIYFGVHPCRFVPAKPSYKRAKLTTVECINAVYCDIDGVDDISSVNFPLKPSYIVASGGGFHCYWLLNRTLPIGRSEERLAQAKHIQRSWVRKIPEADQGVCCLTRILRLPGTYNHKYTPKREVFLQCNRPQLRYDLSQLDIPPQPEPKRYVPVERPKALDCSDEAQRLVQHIHDTIAFSAAGQRNYDCYRMAYLAGRLVGGSYVSGTDMEATLIAAAEANGVMVDRPQDTARTLKRGMDEGAKDPYVIVKEKKLDVSSLIKLLQNYERG